MQPIEEEKPPLTENQKYFADLSKDITKLLKENEKQHPRYIRTVVRQKTGTRIGNTDFR